MKLRPHHLLCIQGYEGKGYSPEFIVNMDEVVAKLRAEEGIEIEIVFGTDQICERCPNRVQKNICKTQEKVQQLDAEVIQLLHLKQKKYIYQELINDLNTHITQGILEKICGRCGWYPMGVCKKNIELGSLLHHKTKSGMSHANE